MYVVTLLAPQSGAHRRGVFRDFHPIQSNSSIAFDHCSMYIQKHLSQSVAVGGTTTPQLDQ